MMKHTILTGALALSAGPALADAVELTVWSDTARVTAYEAFDAAHDDISLNIVTVAPVDQVAKLQLALQGGEEVPDVIFMAELVQVAQLSTRRANYLVDLTDLIDQSVVDGFLPNALTPCQTPDGRLLCLRNDLAHFIVWYDEKLMADNGFTVPTTWEEFEELGHAAAEKGMIVGTGRQNHPLMNFLLSSGCVPGLPTGGDPETLEIDLSSAGCVRGAAMVDRLRASGALSEHGAFEPAFVTAAKEGKLLMFVGSTWFGEHVMRPVYELPEGRLAASDSLRWSDEDEAVTWSWGGGVFGGYHKSDHPEAVAQVITWMTTDIGLQSQATTMPAHAASSDAWRERIASDPFYANDQVYDVMKRSANYGHPYYAGYRVDAAAALIKIDGASDASLVDKLPELEDELTNLARINRYKLAN